MESARKLGEKLLIIEVLESTNQTLRELAEGGEPEGTVVVAEEQRAGRGRLGRGWASPRGGLWFSVLLRPPGPPADAGVLSLLAGVAVARSLRNELGIRSSLKWPNDVLVEGKKLCGILSESRSGPGLDYVVLGFGINANFLVSALPEDLRRSAISVKEVLREPVDRLAILRSILNDLERLYGAFLAGGSAGIISEWKELAVTLGRQVRVETATGLVEGRAEDVDGSGALLVRTPEGPVTVSAGDCVHVQG